jgi:hypothetical protein
MRGTASQVRSWILIEQAGPWGYDAPIQSRLPVKAAQALRERARILQIRIVLIRRPGRSASVRRTCFLAHTGAAAQRLERIEVDDPAELLDLDWSELAAGRPVAGEATAGPLFLVCTNGARDRCCAERGRAVAAALALARGRAVWECSHIGGDRFAGNLVCFPHGIYYGRVAPHEAEALATRYQEGALELDHYRGRSGYDFGTQAAEWFLRAGRGLDRIEDVRLVSHRNRDGRLEATFDTPAGRVGVIVAISSAHVPRRLTCQSLTESHPPVYELLELMEVV